MNLLDYYLLTGVDLIKVSAELFRALNANDPCQARIELKLTPQAPVNDSLQRVGHIITARLNVLGLPPGPEQDDRYFAIEVILNAAYKTHAYVDQDLGFEVFNQHHTSLTRQLLPILERRATLALQELNLAHIRLPYDLSPVEPASAAGAGGDTQRPSYH